MTDYRYTIHKEGRQLIQRQVFDHVGTVIICENRAAKVANVTAMTVYGNYCYQWDETSDIGMVLRSTNDYLMDKFLDGHGEKRVLDVDATIEALYASNFTEHASIGELGDCQDGDDLSRWAERWGYQAREIASYYVYGYSHPARQFMDRVLPLIRESAKELERMRVGMMI